MLFRSVSQSRYWPAKQEEATGMRSAEKNYVLDLQTKKEVNNAILLSAEGGYGTHKRRDINGKIMRFNEAGDNFMITGSLQTAIILHHMIKIFRIRLELISRK